MGVTAHWINPESFERESCALACRRIRGSHTGHVLATNINEIIQAYHLNGKIVTIVTDGAANFGKAFEITLTEDKLVEPEESMECSQDLNGPVHRSGEKELEDDVIEHNEDADDSLEFQPNEISSHLNASLDNSETRLPNRTSCAAHKLNLVMTSDLRKWTMAPTYSEIHSVVTGKLKEIWRQQNLSCLTSDFIQQKLGRSLLTPVSTRWNSFFDSLLVIITMIETKPSELQSIFEYLCVPTLTSDETLFLNEFVWVSEIIISMSVDVVIHNNL